MNPKNEFIELFKENIHREGAEKLLEYLQSVESDFFTAPASTRFHGDYEMGLAAHSVNVYHCLKDYLKRERCMSDYGMNYSDEAIAIVALLHDVCKINCYHKYLRNVKDDKGSWQQVAAYSFEDPEPFGHGEKSVFLISKFLRLTNEEAYAIRFHMGFSDDGSGKNAGKAFEKYPLALALYVADMEASYYMDDKTELEINTM
ncbi:MAG: hydrolase [Clostridia bacterium]|nr:hydrolase [Clostridia bacterium]